MASQDQRNGAARALNLCLVERCLEVGVLLSQMQPALLRLLDLQAANLHLVLKYCIFAAVRFQELALAGDGAADVTKLAVNTLSGCDVDMRTFHMSARNSLLQPLRASQGKSALELTSSARSRSPQASVSSPQPTGWRP